MCPVLGLTHRAPRRRILQLFSAMHHDLLVPIFSAIHHDLLVQFLGNPSRSSRANFLGNPSRSSCANFLGHPSRCSCANSFTMLFRFLCSLLVPIFSAIRHDALVFQHFTMLLFSLQSYTMLSFSGNPSCSSRQSFTMLLFSRQSFTMLLLQIFSAILHDVLVSMFTLD